MPEDKIDLSRISTKEGLASALQALKQKSSLSYRVLAEGIELPTTTVHSWFSGRHLPYPRHDNAFAAVLLQLGVDAPTPWVDALKGARSTQRDSANPYRGLEPYDFGQSDSFFGRDQLTSELAKKVIANIATSDTPVVLVGPSGSGKTSLLRAGLIRTLREECPDWALGYVAIGSSPLQELSHAATALTELGEGEPRTLIIDQFEQLLTAGEEIIQAALGQMQRLVGPGFSILIGLRADHYEQASRYGWLHAGLSAHQVLMRPPSIEDLSKIITEPAIKAGRSVEPALLSTLIAELRSHLAGPRSAGALPHVSYVLFKVAEESAGGLTLADYNRVGGLDGALSKSAEEAYLSLSDDEQTRCRRLFSLLVRLSSAGAPTRRVVDAGSVEAFVGESEVIEPVLVAFTNRRILVTDHDSFQLSHESVLTAWGRLAGWIEDDRNALIVERRVQTRSNLWAEAGEDAEALLAGSDLVSASEALQSPRAASRLRELDLRFVELSGQRQTRADAKRVRARRNMITLVAVAVMMAILATVLAFGFRRSADQARQAGAESESRQLAAQAALVAASDPALSRQLDALAYETFPSLEARSALIAASAGVQSGRYLGLSGPTALATAPSGDRFAYSNSGDGTIRIMDRDKHGGFAESMVLTTPQPDLSIFGLAFTNDSERLVSTGKDSQVTLWDLDSSAEPVLFDGSRVGFYGSVYALEIDRAESVVYGAGKGDGIGVWDLTGSPATDSGLVGESGVIEEIALAADSRVMITRLDDQSIKIWNRDDPVQPLSVLQRPEDLRVNSTEISPDGQVLLVGYAQGTVQFWDISDPNNPIQQDRELDAFDGFVNHLRFSPTGDVIVGSASNGEVAMWDSETLAELGRVSFPTLGLNIRFLNDYEFVVVIGDGSARTFDLRDLALRGVGRNIWSLGFSDAGQLLSGTGGSTRIFDVTEQGGGVVVAEITAPTDLDLSGVSALSPNGRIVALGTFTGEVLLASIAEPTEVKTIHTFKGFGSNVAFSDDGKVLVATSDAGDLALFAMVDGAAQLRSAIVLDDEPFGVSISPDNSRLIVGLSSGAVQALNIEDLTDVTVIGEVQTGTTVAHGVDFHPAGSLFVTSNSDSSVLLWDMNSLGTSEPLVTFEGPRDRVIAAQFSHDGTQLAAASGDGVAWVWRTVEERWDPEPHYALRTSKDDLHVVAFSPDDRVLVGGGADTQLFLWTLDEESARERICISAGAGITAEEWDVLVPDRPFDPPCGK